MSGYSIYPTYRDVELGWISELPDHWDLERAKYIFHRVQRPVRDEDGIVTAFRDGQVTLRSKRRLDGFTNALKEIGYQGVRVGDLLVHAMDGFAGAIGISDSDGKCSPVCSVCIPAKPNCIHMSYYGYLVRQLAVTDFITSLAKGIRERSTEFRYSEFCTLDLAVPPISEQQKIANFLDHETAKIDTLIEKQQQLIKLLKEKRQAVISHAVTKGLNPDAPMKDSGVEWLGEVPAGWKVMQLRRITHLQQGLQIPQEHRFVEKGLDRVEYLTIKSINAGKGNDGKEFIFKPSKRVVCVESDILLARTGATGEVVTDVAGAFHNNFFKVNYDCSRVLRDYLVYMLKVKELKSHLLMLAGTTTIPDLNHGAFLGTSTCLPSSREQKDICEFLDKALERFRLLVGQANNLIDLLSERRTALISAAVTGKIDVRNWQPPVEFPRFGGHLNNER